VGDKKRKRLKAKELYLYPDEEWFYDKGYRIKGYFSHRGVRFECWKSGGGGTLLQEVHYVVDARTVGRPVVQELTMSFLRKAVQKAQSAESGIPVKLDPVLSKKMPAFTEYLTTTEVDGKPRATSTLNISWSPQEGFKAFLNDKATSSYLCVTSETFQGLLEALEKRLQSDDAVWRESKPVEIPKKKRS